MPGDFRYEGCATFCKTEKSQNHCKFCKCRACVFCKALQEAAADGTASGVAKPKKKKRSSDPEGTPEGEASTAHAAVTTPSAASRVSCQSGLKGDFNYQTCGAFCKSSKSSNHCKFCKCKSCTFCGGSSSATHPTPGSPPSSEASLPQPATELPQRTAASRIDNTVGASADHSAVAEDHAGLLGAVGGGILLLIVICGVAINLAGFLLMADLWLQTALVANGNSSLVASDAEGVSRFLARFSLTKSNGWDEGESFLHRRDDSEDGLERLDLAEELHPGLDAAFKHVEKLEANMKRKQAL
ncbi:MAG: hypothetical protein SGPRY_013841 [Prymnesium sp.]